MYCVPFCDKTVSELGCSIVVCMDRNGTLYFQNILLSIHPLFTRNPLTSPPIPQKYTFSRFLPILISVTGL